jgi:hypothetical protein
VKTRTVLKYIGHRHGCCRRHQYRDGIFMSQTSCRWWWKHLVGNLLLQCRDEGILRITYTSARYYTNTHTHTHTHIYIHAVYSRGGRRVGEDGLNAFNGALFVHEPFAPHTTLAPVVRRWRRRKFVTPASAIIERLNINFKLNFTQVKSV